MKKIKKISCGVRSLDSFLDGGFEAGIISTIYGEAATGKSNICLLLTSQAARTKKIVPNRSRVFLEGFMLGAILYIIFGKRPKKVVSCEKYS